MYQVVFTGRLKADVERQKVEANLARLFKATPQQVTWLLRGVPVVVKSTSDAALAERYKQAMDDAGLICEVRVPQTAEASPPLAPAASEPMTKPEAAPVQTDLLGVITESEARAQSRPMRATVKKEGGAQAETVPAPVKPPAPAVSRMPAAEKPKLERLVPLQTIEAARVARPPPSRRNAVLAVLGAILLGVAFAVLLFEYRRPVHPMAKPMPERKAPSSPAATPVPAKRPEVSALLKGHWMCLNNGFVRMGENIFTDDGKYHALTYGNPESPIVAEAIDVQLAGNYVVAGNKVFLHITEIPSRFYLGRSTRADEYATAEVHSITGDSMSWSFTARGATEVEGCMRAFPPYGRNW